MIGYKGLSLSDKPFVSFAKCYINEVADICVHHPFAKEELIVIINILWKTIFYYITEKYLEVGLQTVETKKHWMYSPQ